VRLDPNDPRPPYAQVADALGTAIEAGEWTPGDRLPSIRELSERYGVAPMTIQHALRLLRERGLIVSWQGRGSYVRQPSEEPAADVQPTEPTYDELMRHLDTIRDHLRRLDERVTEVERTVHEKKQ
jgi:DNA-binding GntR family transcriptional regulator